MCSEFFSDAFCSVEASVVVTEFNYSTDLSAAFNALAVKYDVVVLVQKNIEVNDTCSVVTALTAKNIV
jgi:hypothetical protein